METLYTPWSRRGWRLESPVHEKIVQLSLMYTRFDCTGHRTAQVEVLRYRAYSMLVSFYRRRMTQ